MEKYIINKSTCAIIPNNDKSTVIEKYITYNINKTTYEIINESCLYYGSSLIGRISSSEYLLGIKYKTPIIISEKNNIVMFPTGSYKNVETMWFNYELITKYYEYNNILIVEFSDKKVEINISKYVFNNQMFKSSRLDSIIKNKNHDNIIN